MPRCYKLVRGNIPRNYRNRSQNRRLHRAAANKVFGVIRVDKAVRKQMTAEDRMEINRACRDKPEYCFEESQKEPGGY